jgi:hypothetical protein
MDGIAEMDEAFFGAADEGGKRHVGVLIRPEGWLHDAPRKNGGKIGSLKKRDV